MSYSTDNETKEALRSLLNLGREVDIEEIVTIVLKKGPDNEIVELVLMAMECLEYPISNDKLISGINNLYFWREDNT